MQIAKLYNANVYLDGDLNLLGRASEITLPEVVAKIEEHRALGMVGTVELPTGIETLVAKVKWQSFFADAMARSLNPFRAVKLQVRSSLEVYEAEGRIEQVPVVCAMTARFKKSPLGGFKAGEHQEREEELSVTYLKLTVGDRELVEIDVVENIWLVDGEDLLAAYNTNLGG
jgi:P2 family phage contractile tail tube protein